MMQQPGILDLGLWKERRNQGDRPVSVVTGVTVVGMMSMILVVMRVTVFTSDPVRNVMNHRHSRIGDRGWIQGGHVQRIEE
jgi:hypothetical protein